MVIQKLSSWGNSLAIRLPQTVIQQVGWYEGVSISIAIENERLILSPAKPKYTLEELLKEATCDHQPDELEWGESVGAETW